MSEIERTTALVGPAIAAMGFDVVRVAMIGKSRPTLQIMTEPTEQRAITVDDCAAVSRAVSERLAEADQTGKASRGERVCDHVDRQGVRVYIKTKPIKNARVVEV